MKKKNSAHENKISLNHSEKKQNTVSPDENEQYLQVLFDTMTEGVALNEMIFDDEGQMVDYRILSVNRAFYSVADYHGLTVIGMVATELYGMSKEFITSFWKTHREKNTTAYTEMWSPLNNRCYFIATSPFTNNRFVTTFMDISERKHVEKALQESEQKFRLITETIQDIFWISTPGIAEMKYISPGYEKIWGRSIKSLYDSPRSFLELIHPEDLLEYLNVIENFHKKGKPYECEYRIIRLDKAIRWILERGFPIPGDQNNINLMTGICTDITERKYAEEKLSEKEEKFHQLFELESDALFLLQKENMTILEVNKAAVNLYGYNRDELLKMNAIELSAEPDKSIQMISKTSGMVSVRYHRKKDGTVFPVEITFNDFVYLNKQVRIAAVRDITLRKQAEETLRVSEERLRLANKATNDVIWDWDIVNDTQLWNEAGATVFGWTDITKQPQNAVWWTERVHPEDRQRVESGFFTVVNDPMNNYWQDEYRFMKADGNYAQVIDRSYVIRNETGKALRMIGAMQDISERKNMEEKQAKTEMLLRTVLNSAPITIFAMDSQGKFTLSEGKGLERVGLKPGENVGMYAFDLYNTMKFEDYNGQTMTGKEIIDRVLAGETINAIDELNGVIFDNHIAPVYNDKGKVVGIVGVATDITERKTTEDALRESESRYRSLFENSMDAALLTAPDGRIFSANPAACAMFGWKEEEICTMGRYGLVDESDIRLAAALKQRNSTGKFRGELTFKRKNGTRFPGEISSAIFKNKDGQERTSLFINDISERKKTEEKLHLLMNRLIESEEIMRSIAAQQLHDQVGQNLTALSLNLNYLKSRISDESKKLAKNRLDDSLQILNDTIDQIRNIMVELRPSVLDDYGLNAALKWSLSKFTERTQIKVNYEGYELSPQLPKNTAYIIYRIAQEAFHNIVKHAAASNVRVTLKDNDDTVELMISDDGVGFDVKKMLDTDNKTGFGLSAMKERVKFVGGKFQISSVPGEGTVIGVIVKR